MKNKTNMLVILSTILICLLIIGNILNNNNKIRIDNRLLKTNNFITLEKIIIVGDSRMYLIEKRKDDLNIPNSIIFDAQSGASINWFKEIGIQQLINLIKDDKYKYHVVYNLGVNDLDYEIKLNDRVNEYYKLYRNISLNNKNVSFYFLSVNPIDDNLINKIWKGNIRTNNKIQNFNSKIKRKIGEINIKYCNSYDKLNFNLPDGLHYDTNTDEQILYYIINDCISLF